MVNYLQYIDNDKLEKKILTEKLPPPLITLLAEDRPEIQYVALRNISLIVQK
jgi:vesicle coat complex subunit